MRFEFPLGCMVNDSVANLIVAGRCASMTHDVDKFARNMAPTAMQGQAAWTLAAVLAEQGGGDFATLPIDEVRRRLALAGMPVSLAPGAPHRDIEKHAVEPA
jgi:hypothetical protein